MNALMLLFASLQALGAGIGVVGAVIAEIYYFGAIRDGRIDSAEKAHLRAIAAALRFGMVLLLIANIALVLIAYIFETSAQPAFTLGYWIEMLLVLVIIIASWALARQRAPFWLASAAAFTAWWMIALLVFGRITFASFGIAVVVYIVAAAILAALLGYLRTLYPKKIIGA